MFHYLFAAHGPEGEVFFFKRVSMHSYSLVVCGRCLCFPSIPPPLLTTSGPEAKKPSLFVSLLGPMSCFTFSQSTIFPLSLFFFLSLFLSSNRRVLHVFFTSQPTTSSFFSSLWHLVANIRTMRSKRLGGVAKLYLFGRWNRPKRCGACGRRLSTLYHYDYSHRWLLNV